MTSKYAIGIDIGGTKISIALGNERGQILTRAEIPTRTLSKTRACLQAMLACLEDLLRKSSVPRRQIQGIGVCLPGPVDSRTGKVPNSPHLRGWKGLSLRSILSRAMRLPVFLANDANAAAVGEKVFGRARKCRHFVYVTVSTGIGGGIFTEGKLLEGKSFVAGEIGHMTIEAGGEPWAMGEKGCLEAYASGTAIAKYVKKQIKKGKGSKALKKLKKRGTLNARTIGELALRGDELAQQAFRRAGYYLGIGLGNILNILNPEMVILGGGVWKSAPSIFEREMMKSLKAHSWPEAFRSVKVVKTSLRHHVGNLGAMALVFMRP
ncbi:MAG: ROK family protein [Candidatus Omnitrophota bacterium]